MRDARLWNPRAGGWARITTKPLTRRDDDPYATRVTVQAEDGRGYARGAVFQYEPTVTEWMRVAAAGDTTPIHRGWGLTLYLAAALVAGCHGFEGIYSYPGRRSDEAARVWEGLLKHGMAQLLPHPDPGQVGEIQVLPAEAVRALYRGMPGVVLPCP